MKLTKLLNEAKNTDAIQKFKAEFLDSVNYFTKTKNMFEVLRAKKLDGVSSISDSYSIDDFPAYATDFEFSDYSVTLIQPEAGNEVFHTRCKVGDKSLRKEVYYEYDDNMTNIARIYMPVYKVKDPRENQEELTTEIADQALVINTDSDSYLINLNTKETKHIDYDDTDDIMSMVMLLVGKTKNCTGVEIIDIVEVRDQ